MLQHDLEFSDCCKPTAMWSTKKEEDLGLRQEYGAGIPSNEMVVA